MKRWNSPDRIDAKNAAGAVTAGDVWYFTTAPPLPCKVRGGIPIPGLKIDVMEDVRLLWTAACHATGYHVYFGTNPMPGVREYRGVVTGTEYGVGTLQPDTTYYWRVDAMNEAGETTGEVWSFASHTPLPEPVTESNPPDGAEDVGVTAVLSWPPARWATHYYMGGRRRWGGIRRMGTGCTTCWGTCGSGRRTAGMTAIEERRRTAARGSEASAAVAWCAGAPGTILPGSSGRPIATHSTMEPQ